jgi:nitric oxide reductase large subunit
VIGAGTASRRRSPQRALRAVLLVAGTLVTGAVVAVLWRLLAPLARADVVDGGVYLTGHQELQVGQDGWLALLMALLGITVATVQSVRAREPQAQRAVLALVAVAVVGVVAVQVGHWLGPDSLAARWPPVPSTRPPRSSCGPRRCCSSGPCCSP